MTRFGYVQGQANHTMFCRHSVNGKKSILIVYVDDMSITGDDTQEINNLKERLKAEFEIKDLGNLRYFLGIEVVRSKNGIFISQRKYTLDLLAETGKLRCKPTGTPLDLSWKVKDADEDTQVDKGRYQRLVGKLIYLSLTQPEIAFSVCGKSIYAFTYSKEPQHCQSYIEVS